MVKLSKAVLEPYKKRYVDIFAWKYERLKTCGIVLIQHRIPLKLRENPWVTSKITL